MHRRILLFFLEQVYTRAATVDIAFTIYNAKTKQVILSTRHGTWVLPRLLDNGLPFDLLLNNRSEQLRRRLLPSAVYDFVVERMIGARFDHVEYALRPANGFLQQIPMINDELPMALASGRVTVRSDIRRLTEFGVEFEDGFDADDVDAIVYATGYDIRFPFVEAKEYVSDHFENNLYKSVFAPDVEPATLAIIGGIEPYGAIMPVSEMHSRWAVAVIKVTHVFSDHHYIG